MKTVSALILCLVVSQTALLWAQVRPEWIARYNGPGNGPDGARALAVDSDGNVYVTGFSWDVGTGFDYATIKYDPDGQVVWTARYNGPGNDDDIANALAVDSDGNVYVTGQSKGVGMGFDYATIKYDLDGQVVWTARYNGPGNGTHEARALAVDGDGNVYVTGTSTIKYNADGQVLWTARYNGGAAWALAIDGEENVYVTGRSRSVSRDSYLTVKYDADGQEVWAARYVGAGDGDSRAYAMVVDSDGNVYVTGESCESGFPLDAWTTPRSNTPKNSLGFYCLKFNGLL